MTRGVPKSGFRMTKKRIAAGMVNMDGHIHVPKQKEEQVFEVKHETDSEIDARLKDRFAILGEFAQAAIDGNVRSVIVSGPGGLGKSFTVEKILKEWDPSKSQYAIVKGNVKATGLYKLLYKYREPGQVLVFDDADSIFNDELALNFLKAACDTTENRELCYRAEYAMFDDETGKAVPNLFTYEGAIIFISNLDFDAMIEKNHRLTPHLEALITRSHYIDLTMKTKRDHIIRIKQVIGEGMLSDRGLNEEQIDSVLGFIISNKDHLRELSLRIAVKISDLCIQGGDWKRLANVTCLKNR
jgi:hypothetical protein